MKTYPEDYVASYKLLIQEPPLQVLPTLAKHVGLNEAIILQQLHYWLSKGLGKVSEEKQWIYNTLEDWKRQFPFWSEKTIRRILSNLLEKNLIESKSFNLNKFDHTKWYTINYEELETLENSQKNQEEDRSGQNDHIDDPKKADRCGQNDHFRSGQNDHIDVDKMTTSYIRIHRLHNIDSHKRRDEKFLERKGGGNDKTRTRAEEMLEVWNSVVEGKENKVALTLKRKKFLENILKEKFDGDVEKWKSYCNLIKTSKFLMGETGRSEWKASLDWALDSDNVQKVLEGGYGSGFFQEQKESAVEEKKEFNFLGSVNFKQLMKNILDEIGVKKFESWFKDLREVVCEESEVTLKAPNTFSLDYLTKNHQKTLEEAAFKVFKKRVRVRFVAINNEIQNSYDEK